jgi:hypothetical protein
MNLVDRDCKLLIINIRSVLTYSNRHVGQFNNVFLGTKADILLFLLKVRQFDYFLTYYK